MPANDGTTLTLTSDQARQMLDRIRKEKPEMLLAASNSVAIAALAQLEVMRSDMTKVVKEVLQQRGVLVHTRKIAKAVATIVMGGNAASAGAPAEASAEAPQGGGATYQEEAPAPTGPKKQRKRANGEPMTPEEEALEDMMDAATEGQAPNAGGMAAAAAMPPPQPVEEEAPAPPPPVARKKAAPQQASANGAK